MNITPCAGFVEPLGALGVGAIGALACVFAARGLKKLNLVDDSLDCFSLHGVGGFVGAILGGFFDTSDGIIYGGGALLLGKNVAGAAFGVVYSAAVTAVIFFIMRLVMRMRVSEEQELEGGQAAGTFRQACSGLYKPVHDISCHVMHFCHVMPLAAWKAWTSTATPRPLLG